MSYPENTVNALDPFFNPKSIAVVGASDHPMKPGSKPVAFLRDKGYTGKIYPVNPARETIGGLKCYPSLLDIPGQVEMAVISVVAELVMRALEECVAKGVKVAVIFSSGFAEMGPEGKEEQQRMAELARKSGMRILGPNCLGIVNATNGVMATFAFIADLPPVDPKVLGFVTQSGAFGTTIYASSLYSGVGFNYFVSVGNEADLEFADFLEYMVHDPKTRLIGGYLEGARDGDKLRRAAEAALSAAKPVLILKVGRSTAGSRAAASHTGSLAGSDRIYQAFFRQTGIIRMDNYTELIAFAPIFQTGKLPRGKNTVIIANSGGAGVTTTDLCESMGLNVIPLGEETRAKMDSVLPAFASSKNPIDLTAAVMTNPEIILASLKAVLEDPKVDIVLCNLNFNSIHPGQNMAAEIVKAFTKTDKVVVLSPFLFPGIAMDPVCNMLKEAGVPVLANIGDAVKALAHLANYSETLTRRRGKEYSLRRTAMQKTDLSDLLKPGETLSESNAKAVLAKYGIPVTREATAASAVEAISQAQKIGYPVVMKVDSPDIPHKTEVGGIKLGLNNDREVMSAFEEIIGNARQHRPDARINGVSVQEMLPEGIEVIIGVTRDPVFGPTIMFGLGGIFVEVLKDVSFRVAPVSPGDARDMVGEIKGHALLKGVRGKPPADIDAIVEVILRISDLVTDYRDKIEELDINPLVVYPRGVKAADAMLVVKNASY